MKKLFLLLLLYNFVHSMNELTTFDEYMQHEASADLLKRKIKMIELMSSINKNIFHKAYMLK